MLALTLSLQRRSVSSSECAPVINTGAVSECAPIINTGAVQCKVPSLPLLSDYLASLFPSQCFTKHLGINHLCGVILRLLQQPAVSVTSV